MSIDTATAARAAHLARIRVAEEDLPQLADELSRILDFMEQLEEVDVSGVAPLSNVNETALTQREDEVTSGEMQEKILANAPDAREGFFAVPKVVD